MDKWVKFGPYVLLEKIAKGGMAEIYKAKKVDPLQGGPKYYAIKKVLTEYNTDLEYIEMLQDEARITSLLKHSNIAETYEFGQIDEQYYISMEFIEGKDLKSILDHCRRQVTKVPIPCTINIISQVLKALHYIHTIKTEDGKSLKIIHRDISPANILVSKYGEAKIIDFGIAKTALNQVRTKVGIIKGKVKYMSPEQAYGKRLDSRSDVFSAGIVFYELLTNQQPFTASNDLELLKIVRNANYIPPSCYNPEIPDLLERIVDKSLKKSRRERFASASKFHTILDLFIGEFYPAFRKANLIDFIESIDEKPEGVNGSVHLKESIDNTSPVAQSISDLVAYHNRHEGVTIPEWQLEEEECTDPSMSYIDPLLSKKTMTEKILPPDEKRSNSTNSKDRLKKGKK